MDYAIAIALLRPSAHWRRSDNYQALVDTWEDESSIPTDQELIDAYDEWKVKEDAKVAADAAIAQGYLVEPEDYRLAVDDAARKDWNELLTLCKEGIELGQMTNETEVSIKDMDGVMQTVTVLRLRQIIFGLGVYYKTLWDQKNS